MRSMPPANTNCSGTPKSCAPCGLLDGFEMKATDHIAAGQVVGAAGLEPATSAL
jgi:hypothetical protein